jgi:branched-chain amino acid transport system substrate-binding protein
MTGQIRSRRPTRRVLAVAGSVAIVILALSAVWVVSGITRPTVTIVAIIPQTGVSSYLVEIGDAMSMITEKLNKWGGINGMRIRLVVEDCASTPEVALAKFAEAEERYHPLAIITATREVAVQMATIAEERGVVLISVGASPEELTDGKEWTYRYYVTPTGEADRTLETLASLDASSLGLLYMDDGYARAVMARVAGDFQASNRTVESYSYAKDCTDFSELAANVMDNEAVFAVGLRIHYPLILEELNSSGYEGHVLCAIGASIPTMWELPELQGCFVNAPVMYMPSATIDDEVMIEFEDRYGRPLTHQGAIGHDVIRLIWGLLSDSEVSRENLRDLLDRGFVYSGILGVVTLKQGAHNIDVPIHSAIIDGGALRYL